MNKSPVTTKPAPRRAEPDKTANCIYKGINKALCSIIYDLDDCPFYVMEKYSKKLDLESYKYESKEMMFVTLFEADIIRAVRKLPKERRLFILEFAKVMQTK